MKKRSSWEVVATWSEEAVDGGDLEEVGGFYDAVPAEGVDGVGADGGPEDGDVAVVGGAGEVFGVDALVAADGVEGGDAEEREGGPAAAAEALATGADLGRDETEERGGDEAGEEQKEHHGLDDEDKRAGVPARVEGKEGAQAVVVGPVQQEMREQCDEGRGRRGGASGEPGRCRLYVLRCTRVWWRFAGWCRGELAWGFGGSRASGGRARRRRRRWRHPRAGRGRCGSSRGGAGSWRWGRGCPRGCRGRAPRRRGS